MIDQLSKMLPDIRFSPGERFCWSPSDRTITYAPDQIEADGRWALLHETGHAILGHKSYNTDYELLKLEVEAWEKAKELATNLGLIISEDHIQQCLDSYRDWLHRRSTCPTCGTKTIQKDASSTYSCFNCHAIWQVSPSRFCRAYRSQQPKPQNVLL